MLNTFNEIKGSLFETMQQTVTMVFWSMLITVVFGCLIGLLLFATSNQLFIKKHLVYQVTGAIMNIISSMPFLILMIFVLPLSVLIVGSKIGTSAVIVPLSIAGVAFFARLTEGSFADVDKGVLEAAVSTGASKLFIIRKVVLPEALPSLVRNVTITIITILGFSAMAGLVGGGGIGDLAYRYGYQRYRADVMYICIITLIIIVQGIQLLGNLIAEKINKK